MAPGQYLARLALARPLYTLMFKEAVGLLPPTAGSDREPIACGLSISELAKRLGTSPSTTGEEMRRLALHGWLRGTSPRLLGYRTGDRIGLMADMVAEEATGEPFLVSRVVLGLKAPKSPSAGSAVREKAPPAVGRGTMRRWEP